MHEPMPVAGYTAQPDQAVQMVNENKKVEEGILRMLDQLATLQEIDMRWLQIGRTHIEQGFMAINRSIFKPERIK